MNDSTHAAGRIVVGVDGSEHSDRAVDWAAEEAQLENKAIVLVHAIDPERLRWVGEPSTTRERVLTVLEHESSRMNDQAVARIARVDAQIQVHRDEPVADAREYLLSLSSRAAMIVVGSRGRGPVKALVLGSVSSAVAHHAVCPVVIFRPEQESARTARGVLVSVADDVDCGTALSFAFEMAALRGEPLTVLHTLWDPSAAQFGTVELGVGSPETAELREHLRRLVEQFCEKYPRIHVDVELAAGRPGVATLPVGEEKSLVVVGRGHLSVFRTLMVGNLDRYVMAYAHSAVAVVPEI